MKKCIFLAFLVIISFKNSIFFGISYFQKAEKIVCSPLHGMPPLSGDHPCGIEDTKKISSHPTRSCGVQASFSESYFLMI